MKYVALLLTFFIVPVAHATVLVSPTSGSDGIFNVYHSDDFGLYDPSGLYGNSAGVLCTASSTPDYDDCDVSSSGIGGVWSVVDFATSTVGEVSTYNYAVSTSTADSLYRSTVSYWGQVVSEAWPLVEYVGAVLLALFASILVLYGLVRSVDKSRGRRR